MDSVKKYEIKQWLKKKKKWFLASGIFAIVGFIFFFVGMAMAGVDIVAMFTQPFAITCYCFVGFGIGILIAMFVVDFLKRKGE